MSFLQLCFLIKFTLAIIVGAHSIFPSQLLLVLHSSVLYKEKNSNLITKFSFVLNLNRTWNQVLTCVSDKPKADASSTRSGVDRYLNKVIRNLTKLFVNFLKSFLLPLSLESFLQSSELRITENRSSFSPSAMSQSTHSHSYAQHLGNMASVAWKTREEPWCDGKVLG